MVTTQEKRNALKHEIAVLTEENHRMAMKIGRLKRELDKLDIVTLRPSARQLEAINREIAEYEAGKDNNNNPLVDVLVLANESIDKWLERCWPKIKKVPPHLRNMLYNKYGVSVYTTKNPFRDYVANLLMVGDPRIMDKEVYRRFSEDFPDTPEGKLKKVRFLKNLKGTN